MTVESDPSEPTTRDTNSPTRIPIVGVVHPGEMGSALAAGLRTGGSEVVWAGEGRSAATRARGDRAGLVDVGEIGALAERAGLVVSICPPEFAVGTAEDVMAHGYSGVFLDANAIAPSTAAEVAAVVTAGGGTYLDGAVIGGPAVPRLYLAGADPAPDVRGMFGAPVEVVVLDQGGRFAASALKMVYAGWTKGTTALLLALAAGAERLGVGDALRAEWESSQPALLGRLEASSGAARKAWRWGREMDEIGRTLADAGLPDGFHAGAADVYDRLAVLRDVTDVSIEEILQLLLDPTARG